MRPNAARHLIAGLLGALVLSALLLAGLQRANVAGTMRVQPIRALLVSIADVICPPAAAQQTLKFRPVPAESASRFERMRVRKSPPAELETDVAATEPAQPAEPATPAPPAKPEIVIGKSGSVMRIGSDIHVAEDEVIRGDLNTVGGDITIDGHVQGNVVAMRGDVTLASTARVDGDVVCIGGTLHESPGAVVGGERVTAGDDRRRRTDPDDDDVEEAVRDGVRRHTRGGARVMSSLIVFMMALGAAWGLSRFAPARTQAAVDTLRREPGVSLGVGAMVWALVVPSVVALALVVALLCITIIGIPLALAALLGYALFLCVLMVWGYVVGAAVLGGAVAQRRQAARAAAMTPGAVPTAPVAVGEVSPASSTERSALLGVAILGGAALLSAMLRSVDGPPHALGTFIAVIGTLTSIVLTTVGAGAWLRSEFATGLLGRWWSGRRNRPGFGGMPPGPPPAPMPPVTPTGGAGVGGVAPTAPPTGATFGAPAGAPGVTAPPAGGAWTPPAAPAAPAAPTDPTRFAPPPETPGSQGPAGS